MFLQGSLKPERKMLAGLEEKFFWLATSKLSLATTLVS